MNQILTSKTSRTDVLSVKAAQISTCKQDSTQPHIGDRGVSRHDGVHVFLDIYTVTFTAHTTYSHSIMVEIRVIRSALTRSGVSQDIEVEAFFVQVFPSVGDLEKLTPCLNSY